jgi:hypothetical protein
MVWKTKFVGQVFDRPKIFGVNIDKLNEARVRIRVRIRAKILTNSKM